MPHHVVVDGSNLATEGRPLPSLKQLNDAVLAYMGENPDALITVVVDATFGHRIDPSEVPEFDEAVSNNELVTPPAGAIGRGDAFVLSIANKVNATILSNDSYQEFHGQYTWLFDEGRLIGGKPVPHIGWVYVTRVPVRGPLSRKSVGDAKRKDRSSKEPSKETVRVGSIEANQPMPVPSTPPPGPAVAKPRGAGGSHDKRRSDERVDVVATLPSASSAAPLAGVPAAAKSTVNDLLPFLTFVERHPAGTSVSAVVDHYSSHGAYVTIGDVRGYVPLRLMSDPAPRSAREFMRIGETITLVVESFVPSKRSVDLAVPTMSTVRPAEAPIKPVRAKRAPATPKATPAVTGVEAAPVQPARPVAQRPARKQTARLIAAEPTPVAAVSKRMPKQQTAPTPLPAAAPSGSKSAARQPAAAKRPAATVTPAASAAVSKSSAPKPSPSKPSSSKPSTAKPSATKPSLSAAPASAPRPARAPVAKSSNTSQAPAVTASNVKASAAKAPAAKTSAAKASAVKTPVVRASAAKAAAKVSKASAAKPVDIQGPAAQGSKRGTKKAAD